MEIFDKSAPQGMHHIRHNGTDDGILNFCRMNIVLLQQIQKHHAVLIRCPWHFCRNTKTCGDLIALKHPTGNIRISNIYG